MFATYITFYKGKNLPPFYIGYSSVTKIEKGYHGTISSKKYKNIYKQELLKIPSLFETKIIKIFKTKQEALLHEEYLQKHFQVHKNELYINQSIVGHKMTFNNHTKESRKKLSESKLGKPPWNKGKTGIYSKETKQKWSKARKGRKLSETHKQKLKGRIPWNKGKPTGIIPKNKTPVVKLIRSCLMCGKEFRAPKLSDKKFTCGRSCAATYSNLKRSGQLNLATAADGGTC